MDLPEQPVPVDLRDYVDFASDGPSGRRVFTTDVMAVDVVCLEPGQFVGARTMTDADVVYTVLGGRAWIVTAETEVVLEPLQALLVPAGTVHGLRNDSADPLILQATASPPDGLPPLHEGPARRPVRRDRQERRSTLDRLRRTLGGPG
jgi:quercetin dioxygenase-like cupin family protein